jgi:Ca-activated chloride channel family protein
LPKDIVFVFDTSGSMSGEKIDKARNALKFGLESLGPNDRFNVIRFSGEEHLFDTGLIAASRDNIKRATTFVENFRAEGGTNIYDAMLAGLKQFTERTGDRPRMVVFLTDGLPTVGTTDAKAIEAATAKANDFGARIFTFGVGYDVNTKLLDAIARGNRAVSDYIEPNEDLEAKVSTFFGRVNYPVLSDIKLDFGGVDTDLVYPRALPDLFRGGQLVLVGRYKGDDRATVLRLRGNDVGRERTFIYEGQTFRRVEQDNAFLPKLWATRRVGALLEQIRLNGENKELVDEIVSLGTKHGIVTPYTSFLATEGQPMPEEDGRPREPRPRDGVGGGFGGSRAKRSNAPPPPPATAMKAESGAVAVQASKDAKELRDADKVVSQQTESLKTVGVKTFALRDGVWVDTEFDEAKKLPVKEVKFGSDEYFALVGKTPKLADYFALGTRVVVVMNNTVYRVVE